MMVVNGSNIDKDFAHLSEYIHRFDATIVDRSDADMTADPRRITGVLGCQ